VNTVISQSVNGENTIFPDVTICNLKHPSPITPSYDSNDKYNLKLNALNATLSSKEFRLYMKEHFPATTYELLGLAEFILNNEDTQYSPLFNNVIQANYLFSSEDSPITFCYFVDWEYYPIEGNVCLSSITQIYDQDYNLCYTIRENGPDKKLVRSLSALIYVDTDITKLLYHF